MMAFVIHIMLFCLTYIQAAPPRLSEETPKHYTGFADNFQKLKCYIEGGEKYEWFHNGTKIPSSSSMYYMYKDQLFIMETPASNKYQGIYQCTASNDYGTIQGPKIKVYFSIVGRFLRNDEEVEVKEVTVGKDLALTCPPRTLSRNVFYHWGGQRGVTGAWFLPQAKHYMIMNDGTLLFAHVKNEDLEYFNVVKNGVSCSIESKGKSKRFAFSQRFLLSGVGEENRTPFGPTIKAAEEDREIAKGAPFVVFRCGAVGLPTPEYSWTFTGLDGVETQITDDEDGYQLRDYNHVLTIISVETKHDGWYKCRVNSNYSGQEHYDEKIARLSVKGKPKWGANGTLSDATANEGVRFLWLCNAYGNPDPTYTWFKEGRKLPESDEYDIQDGVITFKSISKDDEGVYQCVAANNFGEITSSATLKVKAAPTTLPPTTQPRCGVSKMNLMFLVDGSGSVPLATFEEFKKFMALLVEKFDIGPDTTHVGVLQYSSEPRTGLEFHFSEHQTLAAVKDAISKVKYHYGAYTFGGYAMRLAQQIINHYDRTDAKNVWVLLMDNGLWDKTLARKISKAIRQSGTKVIVLDTQNIMHDIADQGLDFTSDNFEENVEEVRKEICK
ncbi:contactin-5-like [Dendronephthya gigantea]|uniref:contactin-5-like n=1 Tax=Dendronephthya gigantea TaxID=151771 RepID=UPI001069DABB|nr:contactin-5-like [Dendronephthya gigantea]